MPHIMKDAPAPVVVDANDITMARIDDPHADTSWMEQEDCDFSERLASYRAGDFHFIGIRAVLDVEVPGPNGRYTTTHRFTSPGLWGIESDSSDDYLAEVFADERHALVTDLRALGIAVVNE